MIDLETPLPALPAALHVLVASPHRDFASAITAMLKALGVTTVSTAHESSTIPKLLKTTAYDALILDSTIGPEDSVSITRTIRTNTNSLNAVLPIIMISGASDRKFIETARDAGVNEFIRMPVSGEILHARLLAALNHPREFVAAPNYTGPDRRRHRGEYKGPERRRIAREKTS